MDKNSNLELWLRAVTGQGVALKLIVVVLKIKLQLWLRAVTDQKLKL
jgi:hypothetical protein